MDYRQLFVPGKIGRLTMKNRIIMAPMGNINMADPIGRPLPKMIDYFTERARGGTALLITGLVPVSYGIDPTVSEDNDTTYFPRIDRSSRTRLAGWRDLAAAVHAYDARVFIQLTAGLGRVGSPEAMLKGKVLKSASFNSNFYVPQLPHFPLSDRSIKKIVKSFGQSAINAKVSGIDGIHLHGHEGYLMDQLTSHPWNRRKFGRYRNKMQFALDVVNEIKAVCGRDYPVIYRLDLTQALEQSYGQQIFKERFRGLERTYEEGLEFCKELAAIGVEGIDVDKGCYDNWFYPHPPAYFEDAPYVEEMAGGLKKYLQRLNSDIAVIAVGKLGKPDVAAKVMEKGWADFIMLGRPLLADPYWPQKVSQGRVKEIVHCIGDQEGCIQSFIMGGHPCCAVNPYTGFEDAKTLMPAEQRQKVAVIGAGPGGCEAASTAFKRGHDVTLYEKTFQIGGQLIAGSSMKIKHDLALYLENLRYQIEMYAARGLKIRFGCEATVEELTGKYDVIICASGLKPDLPSIPGLNEVNFCEARSFLQKEMKMPPDVKRVTVIGGGIVGCEIAYTLACEQQLSVTIIEKLPELMTGVVHANRSMMLWLLMGKGSAAGRETKRLKEPVIAYTASEVYRTEPGKVYIKANKKRTDPYRPWETLIPDNIHNPFDKILDLSDTEELVIDTDFIIVSTGGRANDQLYYQLLNAKTAPRIYRAGDCYEPGRVWEAVSSANQIAISI